MKIAQKYSHLNGEEYLIVHHKKLYKEIIDVIELLPSVINSSLITPQILFTSRVLILKLLMNFGSFIFI